MASYHIACVEATMSRKTTPTFIGTFELKERAGYNGRFSDLDKMSDFYRKAYNATLGHFYAKAKAMKRSKAWLEARNLPKNKKRAAFKKARKDFGIEQKDFEDFVKNIRSDSSFFEWTNSAVMQGAVANRALGAVDRYIFAKAKRLRFKEKGDFFSFQGKQNTTGVRVFPNKELKATIHGLNFNIRFDSENPYHIHAFSSRVKFSRLLIKCISGKKRYFIQAACEGLPYENKERIKKHIELTKSLVGCDYYKRSEDIDEKYQGVVGLDFGPSHVHIATLSHAESIKLSETVEIRQFEIARLKRRLDRQRRANNLQNYNPDGTIKKGPKRWSHSKGYRKTKSQIAAIERSKVETRKSSHGYTAGRILSYGNIIKTEKVSYKGWQKIFGRSIAHHAPSALEGELTRKAGYARGRCERVSTYQTALSQMCICGAKKKKSLSQRVHSCGICGIVAQRDIFSAYLAIFCHKEIDSSGNEKWALNLDDARSMFQGHRHLSGSGMRLVRPRTDGKPSQVGTSDSATIARGSSSKACDPNLESFWQYVAGKESGADISTKESPVL